MAGKGGGGPTGHRVFVANLPYSVDWKYLKDLFRDNGVNVRHADILEDPKTGKTKGNAIVEVSERIDIEQAIETMNEMEVEGRRIIVREDREPDRVMSKGKGKDGRDHEGGGKADGKGKGRSEWHGGALPDRPRPSSSRQERTERVEADGWYGDRRGQPREARQEAESTGFVAHLENLPPGFPWQRVKDLCRSVGLRVKHADIVDRDYGIACVEFFDEGDARAAYDELNGADVEGQQIAVRLEYAPPPRRGGGRPFRDSRGQEWDRGERPGGQYGSKGGGRAEEWDDRPRGGRDRHAPEPQRGGKRPPPATQESIEDMQLRRLFAENLASGIDWRQLKDLFRGYFEVQYTDVINVGGEAYGIVEFLSRADALEACMQFNGVLLDERPVRLRQDRGEFRELRGAKRPRTGPPEQDERPKGGRGAYTYDAPEEERPRRGSGGGGGRPPGGPRVYVGNLDFRLSWQDLKDHMRQAGNVRFCDVLKDQDGRPKGCGLVEFATEEECENAVAILNETELGNRMIAVRRADERGPRR